jgi:hypothetical protein
MAKKRRRGNGAGTVYPRKNKDGKVHWLPRLILRPRRQAALCFSQEKGRCGKSVTRGHDGR